MTYFLKTLFSLLPREDITMLRTFITIFLMLGLFSCSDTSTDSDTDNAKSDNKKHMLSDQQKMIQKAKDTEKLIHEADAKRRKALEDQDG